MQPAPDSQALQPSLLEFIPRPSARVMRGTNEAASLATAYMLPISRDVPRHPGEHLRAKYSPILPNTRFADRKRTPHVKDQLVR